MSWTGLTYEAANKYFPQSLEGRKGHGGKIPSRLRSTKNIKKVIDKEADFEIIEHPQKKTQAIYTRKLDVEEDDISGLIYTIKTGAFPVVSSKGNRYIMVMLECDSDYILVKPMYNRTTAEILRAHQHLN